MPLQLISVTFNDDALPASHGALTIRKNATATHPHPEWQLGVTKSAEASVAAYAIEQAWRGRLTIQARFRHTGMRSPSVEIRAVQPPLPALRPELIAAIVRFAGAPGYRHYLEAYRQTAEAWRAGNVLGDVQARRVRTPIQLDGMTGPETFELVGARLWSTGVGVHQVNWEWQSREGPGSPWIAFATTSHTIYTTLRVPTAPWQQPIGSGVQPATQLPWTDVLRYACRWAAGATTLDAAAAMITRSVFGLGAGLIEYDCVDLDGFGPDFLGSPHYTMLDPFSIFDCTLFMQRLEGGIGAGRYVNCTDCAAIVATFANILGCDLWQSRMGYVFALNPFLAIGKTVWEAACGNFGSFFMHEVAWKAGCTAADAVFDACVAFDASGHAAFPPHFPVVPTDIRFGFAGQSGYRDQIATIFGRARCDPQPLTRKRRAVV